MESAQFRPTNFVARIVPLLRDRVTRKKASASGTQNCGLQAFDQNGTVVALSANGRPASVPTSRL